MKTVAGLLSPLSGEVLFEGQSLGAMPAYKVSRMGISYISESLNLFTDMLDRPDFVDELLDRVLYEWNLPIIDQQIALGVDGFYTSTALERFREYIEDNGRKIELTTTDAPTGKKEGSE